MLDDALYVPVLRWKPAEMDALDWLREEDRSRLKPILEIIPRAFERRTVARAVRFAECLRGSLRTSKHTGDLRPSSSTLSTRSTLEFENQAAYIFSNCWHKRHDGFVRCSPPRRTWFPSPDSVDPWITRTRSRRSWKRTRRRVFSDHAARSAAASARDRGRGGADSRGP